MCKRSNSRIREWEHDLKVWERVNARKNYGTWEMAAFTP